MKQLAEEHEDRSSEKLKNETKQDLRRLLEKRNLDFEDLDEQWKNFERASKSDREKSGSMWTIERLKWYINREDTAFVLPKSSCDLTGETLDEICGRVDLAIKVICGRHGTVGDLDELQCQPNSTECNTRMIIDAILQPLCVYKGLTLRSEQTIKSTHLPTCRFDYIMYLEVDQPIGVIEAKRQGCLKSDSVAQLIVKLLLLSSKNPNWFYFGILSDAYQFIFAGVSKQKVMFFQTKENQLEITPIKSDDDVRSIAGKISWLIDLAIEPRRCGSSSMPIEEFLAPVAALQIEDSFFE